MSVSEQTAKLINRLSMDDFDILHSFLPADVPLLRPLILAPDGQPYLFRWHLVPHNNRANVYLHIQVASDPERPLHDHPWDNQSVILSGGYDEMFDLTPGHPHSRTLTRSLRKGDVVTRKAEEAHRLILPPGIPYTMTLFSTGPKRRAWGFWYPDGWHHNERHVAECNGVSFHVGEKK